MPNNAVTTDTDTLSRAIGKILVEFDVPKTKKNKALSLLAKEVAGPKHNWGYLTQAKDKQSETSRDLDVEDYISARILSGARKMDTLAALFGNQREIRPHEVRETQKSIALTDGTILFAKDETPLGTLSRLKDYFDGQAIDHRCIEVGSISDTLKVVAEKEELGCKIQEIIEQTFQATWGALYVKDNEAKYAYHIHGDSSLIISRAIKHFIEVCMEGNAANYAREDYEGDLIDTIRLNTMYHAEWCLLEAIGKCTQEAESTISDTVSKVCLNILQKDPDNLQISKWEDSTATGIMDVINQTIPGEFLKRTAEDAAIGKAVLSGALPAARRIVINSRAFSREYTVEKATDCDLLIDTLQDICKKKIARCDHPA